VAEQAEREEEGGRGGGAKGLKSNILGGCGWGGGVWGVVGCWVGFGVGGCFVRRGGGWLGWVFLGRGGGCGWLVVLVGLVWLVGGGGVVWGGGFFFFVLGWGLVLGQTSFARGASGHGKGQLNQARRKSRGLRENSVIGSPFVRLRRAQLQEGEKPRRQGGVESCAEERGEGLPRGIMLCGILSIIFALEGPARALGQGEKLKDAAAGRGEGRGAVESETRRQERKGLRAGN